MAKWLRTIYLQPEWDQASDRLISPQEFARVVADRLRTVRDFPTHPDLNLERDEIADEFEAISQDPSADFDDVDGVMTRLYDWGDTQIGGNFFDAQKVCWVDLQRRVDVSNA